MDRVPECAPRVTPGVGRGADGIDDDAVGGEGLEEGIPIVLLVRGDVRVDRRLHLLRTRHRLSLSVDPLRCVRWDPNGHAAHAPVPVDPRGPS